MNRTKPAKGEFYHIYNRGVDKRVIFPDDSFYRRFKQMVKFYLKYNFRFSTFLRKLSDDNDNTGLTRVLADLERFKWPQPPIELISFCLIPNHFHLQVEQIAENGISDFMQRIGTGYTLYFNLRTDRTGCLFESSYKSIRVENEGQFLCLNRYIHKNPISAGLVKSEKLLEWKWSSLPEYINNPQNKICNSDSILGYFKDTKDYLDFVLADFNRVEKQDLEGISLDDDFGWFEEREEKKKALRRKAVDAILRT